MQMTVMCIICDQKAKEKVDPKEEKEPLTATVLGATNMGT